MCDFHFSIGQITGCYSILEQKQFQWPRNFRSCVSFSCFKRKGGLIQQVHFNKSQIGHITPVSSGKSIVVLLNLRDKGTIYCILIPPRIEKVLKKLACAGVKSNSFFFNYQSWNCTFCSFTLQTAMLGKDLIFWKLF